MKAIKVILGTIAGLVILSIAMANLDRTRQAAAPQPATKTEAQLWQERAVREAWVSQLRRTIVRERCRSTLDWNEEACRLIDEKKIVLGMTDEQLRLSWGAPGRVNRSVGSFGVHEQWIYPRGSVTDDYVYVEDGKVTSWQTSQ